MLTVAEAGSRIMAQVRERSAALGAEKVPLREARGRILAAPLEAERPLPPWDNSAMDGFAVRAADLAGAPVALPVAGVIAAGASPDSGAGARHRASHHDRCAPAPRGRRRGDARGR